MLEFTFFTTGKNSLFSETGSHHLTLAGLGLNYVDEAGWLKLYIFLLSQGRTHYGVYFYQ